jgi:hypothetical protein
MNRLDRCLAFLLAALVSIAVWRASASMVGDFSVPPAAAAKAIPAARPERSADAAPLPAGWARAVFAPAGLSEAAAEARATRAPDDEVPRLIGVAQDGDHRVALLAHNSTVLRVRQGERIGKWTVTQIATRSAVVRAGEKSQALRLDP